MRKRDADRIDWAVEIAKRVRYASASFSLSDLTIITSRIQAKVTDRIITISELLYTSGRPSALKIPMLPEQLRKGETPERSIEFAAATVADRVVLAALVKRYEPGRLFEIGTFRGVTAITLAANAPEMRFSLLLTFLLTSIPQKSLTDSMHITARLVFIRWRQLAPFAELVSS